MKKRLVVASLLLMMGTTATAQSLNFDYDETTATLEIRDNLGLRSTDLVVRVIPESVTESTLTVMTTTKQA